MIKVPSFWFFIALGLFVALIGCATPKPIATNTATDPFADLLSLLGDAPTKHTDPCLINGCVYQLSDIDEDTAKDFDAFVKSAKANNVNLINVTINSPGGEVDSGWSIIKILDKSNITFACTVDHQAYSMAFAILQSCQERYATVTSTLMSHQIKVSIKGRMSEQDFQDAADMVKANNQALANQCSKRLKITQQEYLSKVNNREWWLSANQALEVGAIDRIVK